MSPGGTPDCRRCRGLFERVVDGELGPDEASFADAHLSACAACRAELRAERAWLDGLALAAPLFEAPLDLRRRAAAILAGAAGGALAPRAPRARRWALAGAVAVAALLIFTYAGPAPAGPSELARVAVQAHLRHQSGSLPLEIAADSPQRVSDWFLGKLPFHFTLPNYPEEPGYEKPYHLEGGRLVGFRNDHAAYVAYRMDGRPISLLVTSAGTILPSGGEEVPFRGITFHFEMLEGLKVLTWTDNGLTYALVSDFEGRGQASCAVCHSGGDALRLTSGL